MFGNPKKILLGIWALVIGIADSAVACPACAVSSNQNSKLQTFWAFAVMGILPVLLALVVGFYIRKILDNEKRPKN